MPPTAPYISVLLPVRDGAAFLGQAIESILAQTLGDFECLVVDDGSTDGSGAIAASYARRDPRIRVLSLGGRCGLVAALNTGMAAARAPLVARMDADDMALPSRLAVQAAALAQLPEVALVGSRVAYHPEGPGTRGLRDYVAWQNSLLTPQEIRRDLFVESPLVHPSVLMRRETVEAVGGYRDVGWPEDYDLWMRLLLLAGREAAKVSEVLLAWRDHENRLSRRDDVYRLERFRRLKLHYLARAWLRDDETVQICGAGPTGRWWTRELLGAGYHVSSIVDIDPARIGGRYRGVPILEFSNVRPKRHRLLVGVAARGAREEIREQLTAGGYVEGCDFVAVA